MTMLECYTIDNVLPISGYVKETFSGRPVRRCAKIMSRIDGFSLLLKAGLGTRQPSRSEIALNRQRDLVFECAK